MAKNPPDMRSAAEKAFKAVTTKPADLPPTAPAIPGAKEMVSLRIDRDVLDCAPEELAEVRVVATMVGGAWTHNAPPWD